MPCDSDENVDKYSEILGNLSALILLVTFSLLLILIVTLAHLHNVLNVTCLLTFVLINL